MYTTCGASRPKIDEKSVKNGQKRANKQKDVFWPKNGLRELCIVHFLKPVAGDFLFWPKTGLRELCIEYFLPLEILKSGFGFGTSSIYFFWKNIKNLKNRRERFSQNHDSDLFAKERTQNSNCNPVGQTDRRTDGEEFLQMRPYPTVHLSLFPRIYSHSCLYNYIG